MVLTLQIAATPFHQGLICLSGQYGFTPNGHYDRALESCTATNLPNVMLDLSSDTMVQLHLPFIAPGEYCDIRTGGNETNYIRWNLNNLVPVPSIAGMGPPTYQVFLHLEDIELFGATPNTLNNVVLTAGRKLSPVTEEFEKESHPYSSALYSAGRAVHFIAKGVPSISSIGGPVAWALGKAAGVVRYFGYGKPAVTDPVMRIFRQDNIGEFNTDVASSCMVLAATAANTTAISPQVGCSDVDEMALSYVTSRWGQMAVFSYGTGISPGSLLYGTVITPLAFYFRNYTTLPAYNKPLSQVGDVTGNSKQPTHIMFAAGSFKQWRGGLKFRFTFAKTKMHAGRVMVAFNPYYVTTGFNALMTAPTTAQFPTYGVNGPDPFGYSAIFDLKDGNVFEFKVPFVCPTPYAAINSITGALAMYVADSLIASSVVSSSISVVVEVAGDTDFELANPASIMFPVHNKGTISVQAGRVLSESPEVLNQHTMGEVITSVKQLIAIPAIRVRTRASLSSVIPPWYYQPTPSVLVPASGRMPAYGFTFGGNWASCYTFLKGGTDVHAWSTVADNSFTIYQLPNPGGFDVVQQNPNNRGHSNSCSMYTCQSSIHARLPGFFPTTRVFTYIANLLTGAGVNFPNNPYGSGTSVTPYDGINAVYVLGVDQIVPSPEDLYYFSRNASDDAQLGLYIGPPPIFMPAAVALGAFDDEGLQTGF
jgi:hypothetical protein